METFESILSQTSSFLWGYPMLLLLVATHLYLTFKLRFIQRYIFKAIKLSVSPSGGAKGDISNFGALTTALAATIGTGNIIGVATAVASGGPGAVFWMWLTGVFGIATKYTETLLSVNYRIEKADGSMAGGPMYVLEHGLKCRFAGLIFAACTACAAFGIGNMVQANAVAVILQDTAGIPTLITGAILTFLTAIVILGGVKFIAKVCMRLVPLMAAIYIISCFALLLIGWETILDTIWLIISSAFSGSAAVGGFLGAGVQQALRYGIARGLFSNESGLGSAPIVAAAAQTKNPVHQALISASGTFWDTVVLCALTGIVVVNTGSWKMGGSGDELIKSAFSALPVIGPWLLTLSLLIFVFSTIIGWSYYGEKAMEYLFGAKSVLPYRCLWIIAVFVGASVKMQIVWDFADIANALMAFPNLLAAILLASLAVKKTRYYLWEDRLDEEQLAE